MAPSFAIRVNEKSTFLYTGTLVDENQVAIPPASLITLTLSLYDDVTGVTINGRNAQNVLNLNNVTLNNAGLLSWDAPMADNPILNALLETEVHIARFEWTYGTGMGGKKEIAIRVVNLSGVV